ncbi:ABC transporter permease [Streptomyces scabiei]|uniref:ABC transporter permease n=1 Tax=Streptomyces scabiei TaxID=1930 RepID=UPI00068BF3B2|nr:ABC transporter permease [Streptomyces scabiei]
MTGTSAVAHERTEASGTPGEARTLWRGFAAAQQRFPVFQIVAVLAVFAWGAVSVPGFTQHSAVMSMLVLASLLGLASVGQTLVVLVGGLDLAVAGYIGVGAVAAAQLAGKHHWSLAATTAVVIGVTGLAGAVSGWVCQRFGVQSLVVTLGMYSILISGILIVTGGQIVDPPPAVLSDWTSVAGSTFGLPVPPVVVLWAVISVVLGIVLARTRVGRQLYATGANPRAAALMMIDVARVRVLVFAFGGAVAGVVGMLIAGFASGATPNSGDPYLFSGIAAVVVGGTMIGTARGSYTRTVLGALLLTELTTILAGQGFQEGDNRVLYGLALLIVVTAYGRQRRLNERV